MGTITIATAILEADTTPEEMSAVAATTEDTAEAKARAATTSRRTATAKIDMALTDSNDGMTVIATTTLEGQNAMMYAICVGPTSPRRSGRTTAATTTVRQRSLTERESRFAGT